MFPFPADGSLRLFEKPLLNHHETSLPFPPPKLDASTSPLFPLSPLIFDHELLNDITLLAPPPQISTSSSPPPPSLPYPPDKPSSAHKNTKPSPRLAAFCDLDKCGARPGKKVDGGGGAGSRRLRKDRHSKIYTAQGPRDRRMRLSLDVARKFFDLQDTLGFDKASKTVDWLLSSCKTSIMELTGSSSPPRHPALDAAGNAKSESSTSECEVISASTNHAPPAAKDKRAAGRRPRVDTPSHPPPSRESRQMARERARERTKKKKMFEEGSGQRKQPASSPSPFETGEESGTGTLTTKSSWDQLVAEEGQLSSCSPDQYKNGSSASPPVVIAGGSAPISIFDYGQNIVHNGDDISFVVEQHWDIRPSGNAEEQRLLFADAQLQPFLWEAFNPCI
ncbi:hypothetical protein Taro_044856 [Colocasia esculenta]|uniref:Uncharacterized protein n=1 Tax=Colocasia esculenta TaxID=4460 RepID=A0A843X5W7_COLES|nr:hypothetical protein [Colocasia esculenta]